MKHKFLSLVAATCMLGFVVASANASNLEPMTNASLSTISAKGVDVSNDSYVSLSSGSQNSASGIVIADLSSSAANNQANYASYVENLLQQNKGKAINKVKSEEGGVSQKSSVKLDGSENSASGLMIVNASSSAANNQFNVAYKTASLTQINMGKAINKISGETNVSNNSYVGLSGSQNSASGIVIADLSSSAANNQANSALEVGGLSQQNKGKAINKVKSEGGVSQTSGVNLNDSENFASGLMIVNASSSAANNQLNVAYSVASLAQTNMGKAINIIGPSTTNNQEVSASSGVVLTNSEQNAKGLMIANMSSSAANTQLNLVVGANGYLPQANSGLAVNVIASH